MARTTEGTSNTATLNPARAASTLKSLRSQIDKLDVQLLKLVNERASLAAEIGKIKTDLGENVYSPAREEEVLQHVLETHHKIKGALQDVTIRAIFREIMSGARAIQKVLKVAYLGPQHSFSYQAAIDHFGHGVEYTSAASIAGVFEEVDTGHVDFGVVPLENSTDGRISDTLDQFLRISHLTICSEIRLPIRHALLANCQPQEIARIYSKAEALSQCRSWIAKHFAQAKQVDVSSTAIAADLASREKGAAAIASREAAVQYGLRILYEDIQD